MRLLWEPIVYVAIALFSNLSEKNPVLSQSLSPSDVIPSTPVRLEVPPKFLPSADQLLKPNNPQIQPNLEIPDANGTFVVQEFQAFFKNLLYSCSHLY